MLVQGTIVLPNPQHTQQQQQQQQQQHTSQPQQPRQRQRYTLTCSSDILLRSFALSSVVVGTCVFPKACPMVLDLKGAMGARRETYGDRVEYVERVGAGG